MSLEPIAWVAALALSSSFVVYEGDRRADIDERTALAPKALYKMIGSSQTKLQIVDVRPDPSENYEDTHVPGALPFPDCDLDKTPAGAKDRIVRSVPTIVVSAEGDPKVFEKCAAFFTSARNLDGGLEAWIDASLPEDSGEYIPPKPSAGGGCL
jgi:rhodanese-related sulfurtransferase